MIVNQDMAFDLIVEVEGKEYTNDPTDPGGPTKIGVTLATARKLGFDLDNDGDVDEEDVKLITETEARIAFVSLYWNKVGADAMPVGVDILAADLAYNSGPGRVRELYDYDFHRFALKRWRYYLRLANKRQEFRGKFRGWSNRLDTIIAACESKFPAL